MGWFAQIVSDWRRGRLEEGVQLDVPQLNRSPVTYASVVHSTWPSQAMWWSHAPTFNKWHKKKKMMTLQMLTHGAM